MPQQSYFLLIPAHRWLIINFQLQNSDSSWAFGVLKDLGFRMLENIYLWIYLVLQKADGTGSVLYPCNGPF